MKKIVYSLLVLVSLQATFSSVHAQCVDQGGGACSWTGPSTAQINNNVVGNLVPPCGTFATALVGSGTYTYWYGCQGDNYTFSTVGSTGSTTDSKLTVYYNTGSWTVQRYNDDNGPDGAGTLSSLCWTNPNASSGNYLIVFNQYNSGSPLGTGCGGWVSGETSAILKYRNNGPDAPGTPTGGGTFCSSATLTRAGAPPYATVVYYWQTSPTGTSTANSGATQTVTSSGTWYQRGYNTCSGCWGPASAGTTVTINALPTPSISGTNTICAGGSSTFTASGGSSYVWSTGATTALSPYL
ncbi:MAG: hypothetical protein IPH78_12655 [Bacteroidetes bacterium]|nr:hypothetical protein [Bacteroidota bacterium]